MYKILPKWIKNLDDGSLDKELLTQVFHSPKKPIETPREMNFVIMRFNSQDDVQNAAYYIEQRGWSTVIGPQSDNERQFFLESTKNGYVISEDTLFKDEADFVRVAEQYGAKYDGWYAATV
jgi:hypothetical protein